jgi:hypothetical protein
MSTYWMNLASMAPAGDIIAFCGTRLMKSRRWKPLVGAKHQGVGLLPRMHSPAL